MLLNEADPEAGEMIFMRKCSSCHDHEKDGGHGFAILNYYLTRTDRAVPGLIMEFRGMRKVFYSHS